MWSAYLALLAAPLLRTDLTVVPLGPFVARTNAKKEEPLFRLVERMTKQPALAEALTRKMYHACQGYMGFCCGRMHNVLRSMACLPLFRSSKTPPSLFSVERGFLLPLMLESSPHLMF